MAPGSEKKVDESWKNSIEKEKSSSAPSAPEESAADPAVDFLGFISTLALQALESMDAPHLPQARYLIDIIQLLSDKSKGNLTPEEQEALKNVLYELRIKFVKKTESIP